MAEDFQGGEALGGKLGPQLRVARFSKKPRRTSEHSFEDTWAKAALAVGYPSWHMNVGEAGWPDRYVKGGIWCELKSLDTLGIVNGTNIEQRIKLNELHAAGDRTYYCAKYENSVIFQPWPVIRATRNLATLERFGYRKRIDLEEIIRHVFAA